MEEQRPNEHKQRKKAYLPMIRKKIESGQGFIASIKHPRYNILGVMQLSRWDLLRFIRSSSCSEPYRRMHASDIYDRKARWRLKSLLPPFNRPIVGGRVNQSTLFIYPLRVNTLLLSKNLVGQEWIHSIVAPIDPWSCPESFDLYAAYETIFDIKCSLRPINEIKVI